MSNGTICERTLDEALYIAKTGATVRQTASVFGVGKSTVHQDMIKRLPGLNHELCTQVMAVMDKNLSERHIRGGQATRNRYKNNH